MSAPTRLLLGDSLTLLDELPAESVDALITDPPYGLEFMGKGWDRFRVDDRQVPGYNGRESGAQGGFSDEPSVAFQGDVPATSYGGGKRHHTFRCEGCGKRDQFKKPHTCDEGTNWRRELIDPFAAPPSMLAFQEWARQWGLAALRVLKPGGHLLAFGSPRTYHRLACGLEDAGFEIRDSLHWIYGEGFPKSLDVSKAIDKAAGAERVVLGHVPGGGRMSGDGEYQSSDYGAGWHGVKLTEPATPEAEQWDGWGTGLKPAHEPILLARKPLAGTVVETVLAHGTGALNIEATRIGSSGGTRQVVAKEGATGRENTSYGESIGSAPGGNADAGGRWPSNVVLSHLDECQGSGARHTELLCAPGCPVAELNAMSGDLAPGASPPKQGLGTERVYGDADRSGVSQPRTQLDGGGAARFFYVSKPKRRERIGGTLRNLHPTVKPIDLMRYLVRLATPPGGIVLDPFMGSGTTGCACAAEGATFIGIEQDADSYETAAARIADWSRAHGRPQPLAS